MDKRRFLAAGVAAALPLEAEAHDRRVRAGLGLLTIAGAIAKSNRGPLDPALDKPLNARFALCPWGLYFIEAKVV